MMARHKSNHIQVAYAPDRKAARQALFAKAAAMRELAGDPALARRLGEAARQTIAERFAPEVIGRRYQARLDAMRLWLG
jgi:glycosyltransferase involved in cell wall biosynthesis